MLGGSHERCAPSDDFEILIPDGAPGNPGRHVLNDEGWKEDNLFLECHKIILKSS